MEMVMEIVRLIAMVMAGINVAITIREKNIEAALGWGVATMLWISIILIL